MTKTVKLSEYASMNSVTWRTAFRWFQEGKIDGARKTPGGSIVVDIDDRGDEPELKTVTYARVSHSSRRKTDLEYQSQRLKEYCLNNGWKVDKEYKEVDSGLNDSRKKLMEIISYSHPIRVVVEHKDRLTRFGFPYIECAIKNNGGEIVVINTKEDEKDELMEDFVSIITSFCARIYGRRRSERKRTAIVEVIDDED